MENENQKIQLVQKILKNIQESAANALKLLESGEHVDPAEVAKTLASLREQTTLQDTGSGRVVEGVFDGQHMVGSDGKQYHVPPNYASKSKLVEGDRLKLTISGTGIFLYKQIGPVEREHVVGTLIQDPDSRLYAVVANDTKWQVLTASITYFRGEPGDEVMVLIPKGQSAKWAAVDHVVKQ